MELRQLRYFVAAAEMGNIAQAAEKLNVSQPPVSRQIRALEHKLGLDLFIRTPRGVELTAAGGRFLEDARRILAQVDVAEKSAKAANRGEIGTLEIGFFGSCIYDAVPRALSALKSAQPRVEVVTQRLGKGAQREALLRGSIDIGFGRYYDSDPDFEILTLTDEPVFVAVSEADRDLRDGAATLAQAAERPLALFPSFGRPNFADHMITAMIERGLAPRIAHVTEDAATALAQVAHGDCRALVPASATTLKLAGVRYLALLDDPVAVPVNCIYPKGRASPVLRLFLDVLTQVDFRAPRVPAGYTPEA